VKTKSGQVISPFWSKEGSQSQSSSPEPESSIQNYTTSQN
jgi:hypothetical protein